MIDLSATALAEQALRKVRELSPHDSAADEDVLDITLTWLDLAVGHLASTNREFWLVEEEVRVPLISAKAKYDLGTDVTATTLPSNGIQYPIDAVLIEGANRTPLEIVYKTVYDRLDDHTTPGKPSCVAIDRKQDGTMWVHPVPVSSDVYEIELRVQTYAPVFKKCAGNVIFPLDRIWQKWAIHQVAYDIADGPVRKLEEQVLTRWRAEAIEHKNELLAFAEQEHKNTPHRIRFRDPM